MKEKDESFMCLGPVRSDGDCRREGKVKPKVAIIYLITDPSNVQEHTFVLLSPRPLVQTCPSASPFWPGSRFQIPGQESRQPEEEDGSSNTGGINGVRRERWSELEVWTASNRWRDGRRLA